MTLTYDYKKNASNK